VASCSSPWGRHRWSHPPQDHPSLLRTPERDRELMGQTPAKPHGGSSAPVPCPTRAGQGGGAERGSSEHALTVMLRGRAVGKQLSGWQRWLLGRGNARPSKGLCRCLWIQRSVLQSIPPAPSSTGKALSHTSSQH